MSSRPSDPFVEASTQLLGDASDARLSIVERIGEKLAENDIPVNHVLTSEYHVGIAVVAVIADECWKKERGTWTSANTARDYLTCLSQIYTEAIEDGRIDWNPVAQYRDLVGRSDRICCDEDQLADIDIDQLTSGIESSVDQALIEGVIKAGISPDQIEDGLASGSLNHVSNRDPSLIVDNGSGQLPSERIVLGDIEALDTHLQRAPGDDGQVRICDENNEPLSYYEIRDRGLKQIIDRAYGDLEPTPDLKHYWHLSRRLYASAAFNFVTILRQEYQKNRAEFVDVQISERVLRSTLRRYVRQLVANETEIELYDIADDDRRIVSPLLYHRLPQRLRTRLNNTDQIYEFSETPYLRSGILPVSLDDLSGARQTIKQYPQDWARIIDNMKRHNILRQQLLNIGVPLIAYILLQSLGLTLLGINGIDDPRLLIPGIYFVLMYHGWRSNRGFPWASLAHQLYDPDQDTA